MPGFEQISEEQLVEGFRFTVARAWYRAPDGSEFERHILHHPGAVGVIPLHDDDTVTVVRQYRAALDRDIVEVPAGIRDVEGEDDATTAGRELIEEAGLRAGHLDLLCHFHNSPGFSDETVALYLATDLEPVPHDPQGIEELSMEIERVPLDDLLADIDAGRITDAKTVIGLLTLARRRG